MPNKGEPVSELARVLITVVRSVHELGIGGLYCRAFLDS